jgi:predicted DNA-binding protein (UPF0251 family)
MARSGPAVAVLTGDVVASSGYKRADRRRVDAILREAFQESAQQFPASARTPLSFRITAGDEFQCVLGDVSRSMDFVLHFRAMAASAALDPLLLFRASIGVGDITVSGRSSSYEEDGPAFQRSRHGLEALNSSRRPRRLTTLITGDPELDAAAEAILSLSDALFLSWTTAQWEAIRYDHLEWTQQETARTLGIAHQSVSKRLTAAGWPYLKPALDFLRSRLQRRGPPME